MSRKSSSKTPTATVRCAVYTRKSTEEGLDQEFNSLDAQRDAGEAFITSQKAEGWRCLPEHYDDGGFTGGNIDRPALRRLLADIEAGKVDCVVVYKVDRLSRSLLDFARIMEVFEQRKVAFVSVTQQFNTATSMGRLVLNVLLSFAQFEREIIGERIRDKIAAQRRRGKWTGGTPILGYDVDRSGPSPKLVVNAAEAARVREIFALYLSLGSLLPVVEELAKRSWCNKAWKTKAGTPKGGQPFDRCSLYALLTNPLYVAKLKHKKNVYAAEHEAIIDAEVFEKVQAQLQRNGRSGAAGARNRYGALLRGLLYCKACDYAMVHNFTGRKGKRYRYYTCTHAMKCGRKACPSGYLPAEEIERVVVDKIRSIARDKELTAEVVRQVRALAENEGAELDAERRGLERELTKAKTQFRKQKAGPGTAAKDQKPINIRPKFLVVPVELETDAELLMGSAQLMIDASGAKTKIPVDNPHRNKYTVISAPHLSDTFYTGASGKAWYLFADPAVIAAFEIVFLNGNRTPIIERVEAPPNQLGMGFRGYLDVGVREQDPRGAVKVAGE